jgi:hypothetical protein
MNTWATAMESTALNSTVKQYWLRGDRFLLLLVSLVATLLLVPLVHSPLVQKILANALFTLVFVTGALANRRRNVIFTTAVVLAVAAIGLAWSRLLIGNTEVRVLGLIADVVFFSFTAVMILVAVVRDRMGSTQAISGAVCVYLLMGFGWAHGYLLVEQLESEPFRYAERQFESPTAAGDERTVLSQMVYYSFVTMTTLGYGDVTPRTPLAQTVTWMQAVTGQLFLAVLVARLVSELPKMSRR